MTDVHKPVALWVVEHDVACDGGRLEQRREPRFANPNENFSRPEYASKAAGRSPRFDDCVGRGYVPDGCARTAWVRTERSDSTVPPHGLQPRHSRRSGALQPSATTTRHQVPGESGIRGGSGAGAYGEARREERHLDLQLGKIDVVRLGWRRKGGGRPERVHRRSRGTASGNLDTISNEQLQSFRFAKCGDGLGWATGPLVRQRLLLEHCDTPAQVFVSCLAQA
mmetsp:Transcript_13367/g.40525  ORF Transcript_13367/g.40525 Transcript_13367/m.40525 type:complete len:224 (-) Transcript_13367:121-792(-)